MNTKTPSDKSQAAYNLACGAILRQWAEFETTLIFYFQVFAQISDQRRARVIWSSLPNLQARRKLLNRLAENYLPEGLELKKFRTFMRRMSKLARKRNLIAHAPSGFNAEEGKVHFTVLDQDDDNTFVFYEGYWEDLNNVEQWEPAIKKLMVEMMHYLPNIEGELTTLPKMHREQQDDHGPHNDHRQ